MSRLINTIAVKQFSRNAWRLLLKMRGQSTDTSRTRALSNHGREQELRQPRTGARAIQPMDASKSSVHHGREQELRQPIVAN